MMHKKLIRGILLLENEKVDKIKKIGEIINTVRKEGKDFIVLPVDDYNKFKSLLMPYLFHRGDLAEKIDHFILKGMPVFSESEDLPPINILQAMIDESPPKLTTDIT